MFNVGGLELLVIAIVALVVLGPDKLPGAIRQFGTVVGELRRISQGFQTDLKGALADAERDAERETAAAKKADAAGPSVDNHDPGAAQAVAQAELAAIEGATESPAHDGSPVATPVAPTPISNGPASNGPISNGPASNGPVGAEGIGVTADSANPASSADDMDDDGPASATS